MGEGDDVAEAARGLRDREGGGGEDGDDADVALPPRRVAEDRARRVDAQRDRHGQEELLEEELRALEDRAPACAREVDANIA